MPKTHLAHGWGVKSFCCQGGWENGAPWGAQMGVEIRGCPQCTSPGTERFQHRVPAEETFTLKKSLLTQMELFE